MFSLFYTDFPKDTHHTVGSTVIFLTILVRVIFIQKLFHLCFHIAVCSALLELLHLLKSNILEITDLKLTIM